MAKKTTRVGTRVTATPIYKDSFDWDDFWDNLGFILFAIFVMFVFAKCSGVA